MTPTPRPNPGDTHDPLDEPPGDSGTPQQRATLRSSWKPMLSALSVILALIIALVGVLENWPGNIEHLFAHSEASPTPVMPTATAVPIIVYATPAPTASPTPVTTPSPTVVVYAPVSALIVTDGIYTSGYNTAVLGQEFDAYYLIKNTGTEPFAFQHLYLALDAPDGHTFFLGGAPYDLNGAGPDTTPLQAGEVRKVYMQVQQFASDCGTCNVGQYRLYAVAVLPDSTAVDIKTAALNHSYQIYITVCAVGMSGTPNRCP